MSKIKGRDTKPELKLRSALHRLGLRFRVCRRDLPGKPDIVFPRQKVAVQVRGCFWHQHRACRAGRLPKSNLEYWQPKLTRNVERDAANDTALRALGWTVLVIWECGLANDEDVAEAVQLVMQEVRGKIEEPN